MPKSKDNIDKELKVKESSEITEPTDETTKETEPETEPEPEKSGTIKEAIKKVKDTVKNAFKQDPKASITNRAEAFEDLKSDLAEIKEKVNKYSRQSKGGMAQRLNKVDKLLTQSMKMLK